MTFTPIRGLPTSAPDSLQHELITAIERSDEQGMQLLIELCLIRLGEHWTADLLCAVPSLVDSELVPQALRMLHGSEWQRVARSICISATNDLIQVGVTPGIDISLGIADDGAPILYMARRVHDSIRQIAPHSLHLISAFLQVE